MQVIESHKKEKLTELNRKKKSRRCRGLCSSFHIGGMSTIDQKQMKKRRLSLDSTSTSTKQGSRSTIKSSIAEGKRDTDGSSCIDLLILLSKYKLINILYLSFCVSI